MITDQRGHVTTAAVRSPASNELLCSL